jgi:hypothetical protein
MKWQIEQLKAAKTIEAANISAAVKVNDTATSGCDGEGNGCARRREEAADEGKARSCSCTGSRSHSDVGCCCAEVR